MLLQRDMPRVVKEKEEAGRLLTYEQAKREISVIVKQLKKDVSAVTLNAGEQIGGLTTSLEHVQKGVDTLKKNKTKCALDLEGLHEGKKRAEYECDGLKARRQRVQDKREMCVDAVDGVQNSVVHLARARGEGL